MLTFAASQCELPPSLTVVCRLLAPDGRQGLVRILVIGRRERRVLLGVAQHLRDCVDCVIVAVVVEHDGSVARLAASSAAEIDQEKHDGYQGQHRQGKAYVEAEVCRRGQRGGGVRVRQCGGDLSRVGSAGCCLKSRGWPGCGWNGCERSCDRFSRRRSCR